jgi:hypothetical protein
VKGGTDPRPQFRTQIAGHGALNCCALVSLPTWPPADDLATLRRSISFLPWAQRDLAHARLEWLLLGARIEHAEL